MAASSPPQSVTEDAPLEIPARLPYETTYQPVWTRLLSPLQSLVSLLPSHQDTRKGRQRAKRLQIGLGVVGLAVVIFGGQIIVQSIGAAVVIASLFLPISDVNKRTYLGQIRDWREGQTRTITRPGRIIYDGRRVMLEKEGSKLRRVLTDRDQHTLRLQSTDAYLYLKIAPDSEAKSDTIWIGTDEIDPSELESAPDVESIEPSLPDRPAIVEREGWLEIWRVLHES